MGFGSRVLTAGGLGLTAAFVVACGSSSGGSADLLSHAQSATISAELSTIADAVSANDCGRARAGVNELNSTLAGLPDSVNQKLVHNLGQGAETTRGLALRECRRSHPHTSSSSTSSSTSSSATTSSSTPTTASTPATQSATATETQTQTQTHTQTQVGTGGVTSLSNTTTNGGAGLNPGAGG